MPTTKKSAKPTSLTKKPKTRVRTLAATIAKMQKQAPELTAKIDKLLAKIAKLAPAVAKHEQAENELKDTLLMSGFATDYYDYLSAKREEDRDAERKQKKV